MRTLYHSPLLPQCRAIRMLLREKELVFELKEEPFWERRLELFKLNPSGELPILHEEGGLTLCGAYSIYEHLETAYPSIQCLGNSPEERANVRRLVEWFDRKFYSEVTEYVLYEKLYKRLLGYGEPDSTIIRSGKRNLLHHLDYIAHLLMKHQWIAGNYLTLADLVAAAHLSALDYLGDVPWEHHQATKEWYALVKSRPSMHAVLQDRFGGITPPDYYDDPDF